MLNNFANQNPPSQQQADQSQQEAQNCPSGDQSNDNAQPPSHKKSDQNLLKDFDGNMEGFIQINNEFNNSHFNFCPEQIVFNAEEDEAAQKNTKNSSVDKQKELEIEEKKKKEKQRNEQIEKEQREKEKKEREEKEIEDKARKQKKEQDEAQAEEKKQKEREDVVLKQKEQDEAEEKEQREKENQRYENVLRKKQEDAEQKEKEKQRQAENQRQEVLHITQKEESDRILNYQEKEKSRWQKQEEAEQKEKQRKEQEKQKREADLERQLNYDQKKERCQKKLYDQKRKFDEELSQKIITKGLPRTSVEFTSVLLKQIVLENQLEIFEIPESDERKNELNKWEKMRDNLFSFKKLRFSTQDFFDDFIFDDCYAITQMMICKLRLENYQELREFTNIETVEIIIREFYRTIADYGEDDFSTGVNHLKNLDEEIQQERKKILNGEIIQYDDKHQKKFVEFEYKREQYEHLKYTFASCQQIENNFKRDKWAFYQTIFEKSTDGEIFNEENNEFYNGEDNQNDFLKLTQFESHCEEILKPTHFLPMGTNMFSKNKQKKIIDKNGKEHKKEFLRKSISMFKKEEVPKLENLDQIDTSSIYERIQINIDNTKTQDQDIQDKLDETHATIVCNIIAGDESCIIPKENENGRQIISLIDEESQNVKIFSNEKEFIGYKIQNYTKSEFGGNPLDMKINLYFRKNIDDDEELKDDRLEKRTREHFKSIIHNSFRNQ